MELVHSGTDLRRIPLSFADRCLSSTNVFAYDAVLVPGKALVEQQITVLIQISRCGLGKVEHPGVLPVCKFELKSTAFS